MCGREVLYFTLLNRIEALFVGNLHLVFLYVFIVFDCWAFAVLRLLTPCVMVMCY